VNAKRIGLIAGVAVAVFVLDRVTKAVVVATIPMYETREVVGPYLRISHVPNSGAAFGLAQDRAALLSVLSIFAVLAILYYYRTIAMSSPWIAGTLGMQLGGAFGNLVDRVTQGYVVDFIDVGIPNGPRFWSFNVADSSIVVGIFLVTFLLWLSERQRPAPA
jgi:signal peptidase II